MMINKRIRIHKSQAAFIYCIFESLEGMVSYGTLDSEKGGQFCDLLLHIPVDCVTDISVLLEELRKEFPILEIPYDNL